MGAAGDRRSIGFVGVGAMGRPMVSRLAGRGHRVLACDSDHARLAAVAGLDGVVGATSLKDLGDVGTVVCMLPDSDVVEQVVSGPGGLLEVLATGSIIVDMGSSVPRRTQALAQAASLRGIDLVDAPVSGGVARAVTGELTAMFGGSQDQLARVRPVLEAVAATVVPMGPVGAGHAMKALNNVLSAVGLSIACEVIEVGRTFGLDPVLMLQVVNQSTGRNHATETKVQQFVLSETFASGFLLRLMLKDLVTAKDLARDLGVATPLSSACLDLWAEAAERLSVDADQTRIATVLADMRST